MQMCRPCMARRAQAFRVGLGPFSGPGKKSAGMQPTLLVTTGGAITSTVIWAEQGRAGQILYRSKFNAPYLTSIVHRLPSRGAGDPTSIAWQSRPNSTTVPVVKTCLLILLWLMTGLLEISSLFLSRPPQALFVTGLNLSS